MKAARLCLKPSGMISNTAGKDITSGCSSPAPSPAPSPAASGAAATAAASPSSLSLPGSASSPPVPSPGAASSPSATTAPDSGGVSGGAPATPLAEGNEAWSMAPRKSACARSEGRSTQASVRVKMASWNSPQGIVPSGASSSKSASGLKPWRPGAIQSCRRTHIPA